MTPFVHLHVHSQYSVLDGQASIEALVNKAIDDKMPALAITDHGNMFGIKEFFNYVNKKNNKLKGDIKKAEENLKQATTPELVAAATAELEKVRELKPLKPIIGCEMYVASKDLHEHIDKRDTGRHLIVLAKNKIGYHNLIKLVSKSWTEGFYSHPRTDKNELSKYHEGLIICSACIGGEIPRYILQGDIEEAEKQVLWFKQTFGNDYYLELQRHRVDNNLNSELDNTRREVFERQQIVNPVLIDFARKHDIKLVCTNDVHFVNAEDADAHERLICVSTGKKLSDISRMVYTKQEWMKTTAEMNELFKDIPEAIANTVEVANKIEVYDIDHAPIMPTFAIPDDFGSEEEYRQHISHKELFDEFTQDENGNVVMSEEDALAKIEKLGGYEKLYRIKFEADYLKKLTYDGAKRRYGMPLSPELEERIKFELHIMKTMGFPGYFLIVQDFINVARHQLGVSVGPGRGSAAGSCVAYCLGITQIDPIKYDLLFERFLNPDRISLPDIDIDFDDDGRADVLKYVTDKYGEEKVAHIITYGTMAAKSAIKDVARVEDLPLSESNRLTKLIPSRMPVVNGKELALSLDNCYTHVAEFKTELVSQNPIIPRTLKYAAQLEGNVRSTGVHACGVIICRDDITDWVPVSTAVDKTEGKLLVTQYEGKVIEETGLIKMDFLGLKTLSILKEAVANIKLTRKIDVDLDNIPIDDPLTYKLYSEGRTKGTFQFESAGMQKYLRELQPSTFEDLIAMNALYRPGPMEYIPDFISRKHGRSPIVYDIPIMEQYLKDTYGVTVYQEQVMLLSRLLANFTRGESDTLRKAMGKKLIDKMNHLKGKFLAGGKANGHDPKVLEKIWTDWEKFAHYAFNKSHATCYSWVAFQTAYLKANYPAEYMAAVLSRNRNDITKLRDFMDECKSMNIQVKGPDVNESFNSFGVSANGDIRFGIAAIKGVGENVATDIIRARNAGGPFKTIYDFVERVPLTTLNRRTFESLAYAGAFDCFTEIKREDFFEKNNRDETLSEQLLKYGQLYQNASQKQTESLFGDEDMELNTAGRPQIKPAVEWPLAIRLEYERELVGIYLSANPLDPYYMELQYGCNSSIKEINEGEKEANRIYTFGGMVTNYEEKPSRRGGNYGRITIEDYTGSTDIMLFSKDLISYGQYGKVSAQILIKGQYVPDKFNEKLRFQILSINLLEDVKDKLLTGITVKLATSDVSSAIIDIFKEASKRQSTNYGSLTIDMYDPELNRSIKMLSGLKVPLDKPFTDMLNGMDLEYSFTRTHK